jgi:ankyrin repeat protein
VKTLDKKWINVKAKGSYPLVTACWNEGKNSFSLCKYLIDNDADVDLPGNGNLTALHTACSTGNQKLIQLIWDHAQIKNPLTHGGKTPLHYAVKSGKVKTVQWLLETGKYQPCTASGLTSSPLGCPGLLHLASCRGDLPMVKLLFQKYHLDIYEKQMIHLLGEKTPLPLSPLEIVRKRLVSPHSPKLNLTKILELFSQ